MAKIKRVMKIQNDFERRRGIVSCPEKSVIVPISQDHKDILVEGPRGMMRYPVKDPKKKHKILGLNVSQFSFTNGHVSEKVGRAEGIMLELRKVRGLGRKAKLHLVKSIIIPTITYPSTVIASAAISNLSTLQAVVTKSLKFVFDIRYPIMKRTEALHRAANLKALNQIIHVRSSNMWENILQGRAADINITNNILSTEPIEYHRCFKSSMWISLKEEPPPLYTANHKSDPNIKEHYEID